MQVGLHRFHADSIEWLRTAVAEGGRTRRQLAQELCERENWRNEKGELCLASARRVLPKLAGKLGIALPPPRERLPQKAPTRDFPDLPLRCSLTEIGEVALEPVSGSADRQRWRSMMETHHPQRWMRPPGAQRCYWIASSRHGRLGGIGFCAAGWHQKARDEFVGWSADARVANLQRMVNNNRFLLLPGVRVHGLASRVLDLAAAQLPGDWEAAYGVRPLMAYTYVSPDHSGACYRAAGWERCGRPTSGLPPGAEARGVGRSVWMKPLAADWKERLRRKPERTLGLAPEAPPSDDWAEREYGRGTHPDGRIRGRMVRMGRAWEERPGQPVPVIFPDKEDQDAAYRLLSNPRVNVEHVLESHEECMVERCRRERVVLAVQDTTILNCNGLQAAAGLAPLGGGGSGTKGVAAHFGLAITTAGRPLGVFEAAVRDDKDESVRWLKHFDKAQEIARACPGTRVVAVCDREGDIWELLSRAVAAGAGLVVRTCRSKRRRVLCEDGGKKGLWDYMAERPVLRSLNLAACGGGKTRKKREATLDIRAARVRLAPPGDRTGDAPLSMLAVSVAGPQDRLLLATEGKTENAIRIVEWYERRWTLEEYFKTLKSGMGVEDRRFDDADDLRKCLAFDAVTACRVFDLRARDRPDAPAAEVRGRR